MWWGEDFAQEKPPLREANFYDRSSFVLHSLQKCHRSEKVDPFGIKKPLLWKKKNCFAYLSKGLSDKDESEYDSVSEAEEDGEEQMDTSNEGEVTCNT